MDLATADYVGMLATVMNAVCMQVGWRGTRKVDEHVGLWTGWVLIGGWMEGCVNESVDG